MEFSGLPTLVAVIETGSVQAAARRLGISRPTVRRRLAGLEESVGVKLLIRRPTGIVPTEAGRLIVARGREMLDELAALVRTTREGKSHRGALRVAVPAGVPGVVGRDMSRFVAATWPGVTLTLISSSVPYEELLNGIDCMITLRVDDPGPRFSTFELLRIREQLSATEPYLAERGPIATLEDLASHPVAAWFTSDASAPSGLPVAGRTIDWDFVFCADSLQLLSPWIEESVTLSPYLPKVAAMAGLPRLVPVLPALVGRERPLRLVVAKALIETPVVKSFVEATRLTAAAFADSVI